MEQHVCASTRSRRGFLRMAVAPAAVSLGEFSSRAFVAVIGGLRARLSLNGTWEFRLDPEDVGVHRRWFSGSASYPDTIQVPGCWQTQGFGAPHRHLRHDYQGKAWYRRTLNIPADWEGRRIWIHVGGASNTAHVFVNNRLVGFVESFLTPYEFDATDAVKFGSENLIVCRVDSTGPAPVGTFNFIGRWGGLYREMYIEARSDPRIDELFVLPDVRRRTASVRVTLRRIAEGSSWSGELSAQVALGQGVRPAEGRASVQFRVGETVCGPVSIDLDLPDGRTWSPESPFLHTIEAKLFTGGELVDRVLDRFGMRQFEAPSNGRLLLNGQPYFVRGIGDDSVEVITGILQPDKQVYIDRFNLAKRYGFNGVRYLGHTPAKEVFEAADEVGFLIMAEGGVYQKIPEVIPLLKKQVGRIVKSYRNHPSWYCWSSGNEFFDCQGATPNPIWTDYIQYAHDAFRKLDPTRFFIASDGTDVFPSDVITQRRVFENPEPRYQSRPHIWHEFPNTYLGPLPDLTIDKKWTGVFQDHNCISSYREQVAELGLTKRYPEIRKRSLDLFYLYLKHEFELARASHTLDGYAYWCMTDFPGDVEGDMTWYGMFSTVYEPEKFPDPEPILRFNRETVLVIDAGPADRVLWADQRRVVALSLSHYGTEPIRDGRLAWEVFDGDETLSKGAIEAINLDVGDVKRVGGALLGPFSLAKAKRVKLRAQLTSTVCIQSNEWDFWIFPAKSTSPASAAAIACQMADSAVAERLGLDASLPLNRSRLVITDRMTPSILDYVANGGAALILAVPGVFLHPQALTFWPPWIRSGGTWIEDHPSLRGFPSGGFCSYQFYRLFAETLSSGDTSEQEIQTIDVTGPDSVASAKVFPIIWALTTGPYPGKAPGEWWKPDSRWKLYKHGILCEARIGKGRILVTGLRVPDGIRKRHPEARHLLDCLLNYVLSDQFGSATSPMTIPEARRIFTLFPESAQYGRNISKAGLWT